MEGALPYRIPGPAGGVCTSRQAPDAPEKPVLDLFGTAPWREMLAHVNQKIPSSIALLRRNALSNEFMKLAMLPVLIDSLVYVGKDASVVLRDPTGHVRGTIHADVFVERKGMLDRGVVLLLNGVSALAYLEESRGFRGGEDFVHLSVQACHVSNVFKGGSSVPEARASFSLLDDYEPQARRPKPVVKPPVMRTPLRERNYQRPTSRGFQPISRAQSAGGGGRGGRGPPYPNQQPRPNSNHRMNQQHPRHPYNQYQRQHNLQGNHPHMRNAHNQNTPNQRPIVGSNQHKRPFRSPAMKSSATERAMPPPQKRPNVRQYHQPNIPPPQQAPVAGAITDHQLESLLGDLDVDAIIAAHGKSKSPPSLDVTNASRGPPSRQGEPTRETVGIPATDRESSNASLSAKRRNDSDACEVGGRLPRRNSSREHVLAKGGSPVVSQIPSSEAATNDGERRVEAIDLITKVVEPDAPKQTEQSTILNVDQDMVNDLFEGVDTSEFM